MSIHIRKATPADLPRALAIWRAAVDATHGFLTPEDRVEIDRMVEHEHLPSVDLWVATDAAGTVQAFLGMGEDEIDSLFVDPAVHGQGYGSALVAHALALVPGAKVDASEQAPHAIAFYEARGFVRTGRSETDPAGRPYPLIHFRHPG
ncbi:putative acetyltransferase [Sphingobium sp. B2D3A]|uniref:acetyltransferase n=1 Tax=unclassified Sphingobium TaxID=2611147 RepID=UPI00222410F9|nr:MULTISPECIES: acetyltransferase [unclassified Sphingobium]MCW2336808.1 putative acetyltransferase [Sphingobium sp. B2D3A]MCW2351497.1 putative acetyltransferase [Sphingobium sp. B12D2B]MCW2386562.1 putative acetyltransferase [Sphingobium sp. B2D3D]